MKNLILATLLIRGVMAASAPAFGQNFTPNNLYFGFQNGGAGSTNADYIINLGPASAITNGSSVVDLSADFSFNNFTNVLGRHTSMSAGVVGGSAASSPTSDVFLTQLRSGGAGNPAVPGSIVSAIFSRADDNNAVQVLGNLNVSSTSGVGILDASKTWEGYVEPTFTTGSFYGETQINPDSSVSTSGVIYEDLWFNINSSLSGSSGFVYLGYFTLNPSGSPQLAFTPKSAPAPLTKAIIFSLKKTGNTVTVISSNAVPTHTYQLLYTLSLNPTNWVSAGTSQTATTTMVTNTDSNATDAQRYYEIQAQ